MFVKGLIEGIYNPYWAWIMTHRWDLVVANIIT